MLYFEKKARSFGLEKNKSYKISLADIKLPAQKHKHKKKIKRNKVDAKNFENVDVNNLFSNVWTKKVDIKKTKTKRVSPDKDLSNLEKDIDIDKIIKKKNIDFVDKNEKKDFKKSTSSEDVNKYLAKIQSVVYRYFYPPANSAGFKVVVYIKISALGRVLDFRILNYSGNEELDSEADKIKQRLRDVVFPKNPDNKTAELKIELIPEEK